MVHLPHGTNSTLSPCDYDLTLSPLPYRAWTNKTGASHDKIYHCGVDHCVRARYGRRPRHGSDRRVCERGENPGDFDRRVDPQGRAAVLVLVPRVAAGAVLAVPVRPVAPARTLTASADVHVLAERNDRDIDVRSVGGCVLELGQQFVGCVLQ